MLTLLPSSPSNEELAARAQHGCMPSFEELLRRFQVPLLHYLRQIGPEYDAEDVLQETFLRTFSRLAHYRSNWRFSTWLFTIARRASINYHRRPRPGTNNDLLLRAESPGAGPEQRVIATESRQYLWSVCKRILSEEEQTALWLHYVEQMPVCDIATVLDRSNVSVKTMMCRARQKLRPFVKGLEPEGRSASPARPAELSHG